MKIPDGFRFLIASAFVLVAGPVVADSLDMFMENVQFVAMGQGLSNGIAMIDGKLADTGVDGDGRARLAALRIDLMTRDEKRMHSDLGGKIIQAALTLAGKEVFGRTGVRPEIQLEVYDFLERRRAERDDPSELDETFIILAKTVAGSEEARKKPGLRAAFEERVGDLQRKRHCSDLALASYRAAAGRLEDPARKASLLFKAALAARAYRDLATSSAILGEIEGLDGVPYEVRKRALLIRGENEIFADEHSWSVTPERVARARAYVADAMSGHSPLAGSPEAVRVLFSLVRAMAMSGDLRGAVKMGREMLDGPMTIEPRIRSDIMVFLADTYHDLGDYGNAVKYYELGMPSSFTGGYKLNLRIARSARAGKDFFRAMQAYSDALKYCNPQENRDEIAQLTGLISQMNKVVRKDSSAYDSEIIFSDFDEELGDLSLEEQ